MSNTSPQHIAGNIGAIFGQLKQQDVEEFYIGYQYWNLQHQIEALQIRLDDLRKQIIVNTERMQEVQPTAIELATLARLQSNGVSDVDLLDRMLERGESWLDRTMQRLDYFEQLDDFISDDYTEWCQHALEGAYDWIDSMLDGSSTSLPTAATSTSATTPATKEEELIEATEELFLQKISNDDDESAMLETTMKRPSITIANLEEAAPTSENTMPVMEEANPVDTIPANELPAEEVDIPEHETDEAIPISEEALSVELSDATDIISVQENATLVQESVEVSPVTEEPSSSPSKTSLENVSRKRPNFIKCFFGKIWRS